MLISFFEFDLFGTDYYKKLKLHNVFIRNDCEVTDIECDIFNDKEDDEIYIDKLNSYCVFWFLVIENDRYVFERIENFDIEDLELVYQKILELK